MVLVIALAVLKLVELIPNAQTWAMWIGIVLALLGVVISWYSLRRA